LRESLSSRFGHLLHGREINVETRPGIAESLAGNDSSPLGGLFTEFFDLFRCKLASWHSASCTEVKAKGELGLSS